MDAGSGGAYVSRARADQGAASFVGFAVENGRFGGVSARDIAVVRAWLWTVAALVFLMVIVGGATRLTESGLSITEWKPVTGVLPPLSEADWQAEFDKYKRIPQYSRLFPSMTLADFKVIFYWEWGHRLLGRLIGLVFALPLLFFWLRRKLPPGLLAKLLGVLALGALQGAVGWWMVVSGLTNRVEVAPERLAVHLLLASVTFLALVVLATGLRTRQAPAAAERRLRGGARLLVLLVLAQIGLGALVAGSRAGLTYNTWPLMDGRLVPPADNLFRLQPWWLNFLENVTTVQFEHRMMAYVLLLFALWYAWRARRIAPGTAAARRATVLAGVVVLQAGIGVLTLLLQVPIWAGLLHQAMAMGVLAMAAAHLAKFSPPEYASNRKSSR